MYHRIFSFVLLLVSLSACRQAVIETEVSSPNGDLKVRFFSTREGEPAYQVLRKGELLVDTSFLGFSFKGMDPMQQRMLIIGMKSQVIDETWEQPLGEQRQIRNHCNELRIELQESLTPRRMMNVVFRVFDDGLGFRYEFPEQANMASAVITSEVTQFRMMEDHTGLLTPFDTDSARSPNTPLTLQLATETQVTHLCIHEADSASSYPALTLGVGEQGKMLYTDLIASADGTKAKVELPFSTPWRTIQIADSAEGLTTSNLILNLSQPTGSTPTP